jgi:hypothetical protein
MQYQIHLRKRYEDTRYVYTLVYICHITQITYGYDKC